MQLEMDIVQQELIGNGLGACKNSLLPTVSLGEGVIAGVVSALDTLPYGRSNQTEQLPLFSDDVFRHANLSKQTCGICQTSSSPLSLFRRFISSALLAPISQLLALDPGFQELVSACFLKESDHCNYSKFRTLFLRMCKASSAVAPTQHHYRQLELFSGINLEDGGSQRKHVRSRNQLRNSIKARISSGYSGSLDKWGIVVPGNSATETNGFPKTDPESSLLVVTGNIQCRKISPGRPTLQDCLDSDAVAINSASFESIDESFTLRANSGRNGNPRHPVPLVLDQYPQGDLASHRYLPNDTRLNREETSALTSPCGHHPFVVVGSPSSGWQATEESPTLTSSGWLQSPNAETQKYVLRFAVMYRAASGDRLYTEVAPTLRSLANTGGKHQGGSGAWKVVEYKGEDYAVAIGLPDECSTLAATEAYLKTGNRPRSVKDGRASLIPMGYRRQRPLSATEFERLMGWPTGSTKKGIDASGKEITISKTQRQKMLGNGIIPQEIQDLCLSLKPFLESSYHQSSARSPGEGLPTSLDSWKPQNLDG